MEKRYLRDAIITICVTLSLLYAIEFAQKVIASDKPFGELLGTIGHDKIYRFETPSAVCFVREASISCVPNK